MLCIIVTICRDSHIARTCFRCTNRSRLRSVPVFVHSVCLFSHSLSRVWITVRTRLTPCHPRFRHNFPSLNIWLDTFGTVLNAACGSWSTFACRCSLANAKATTRCASSLADIKTVPTPLLSTSDANRSRALSSRKLIASLTRKASSARKSTRDACMAPSDHGARIPGSQRTYRTRCNPQTSAAFSGGSPPVPPRKRWCRRRG